MVSSNTLVIYMTLMFGLGLFFGTSFGKYLANRYWHDRDEWLTGQRTVEQHMTRDGWHRP